MQSMTFRYWLILVFVSLLWGGTFFFNAILIKVVSPWTLTAGRVTIGAIGVWAYLLFSPHKVPSDLKLWVFYFLLGAISYALPFTAIAWGQQQITGGLASIINAMAPMTMLIVSHFWPDSEKATPQKLIGIFIGFMGVVIFTLPKVQAGAINEIIAYLAVFSSSLLYAIGFNLVRKLKDHPPVVTAAGSLTGAAVIALIAAYLFDGAPENLSAPIVWSFLGLGLLSTSLAFSIMYYLLPKIGLVNFSTVTFMVPISAILLGTLLLGETIESIQLTGMAVIFLGLLFIDGRVLKRFTYQR
ncbi:MAG: DMT family transporter [Arenicellales bacterium]